MSEEKPKRSLSTALTQGRVVRYVAHHVGPAKIVWPAIVVLTHEKSIVSLCLFTDTDVGHVQCVPYDASGAVHTWHWPHDLEPKEPKEQKEP